METFVRGIPVHYELFGAGRTLGYQRGVEMGAGNPTGTEIPADVGADANVADVP
jgi:hypothetical protein